MTTTQQPPADDVVIRLLGLGGAIVELHRTRFTTTWSSSGPPCAAHTPYEVDGFNWRCLGCDAYGREGDTYNDPGYRDFGKARNAAQEHAAQCRAMPKDTPRPRRRRWPTAKGWVRR
jgi:hypothetical protein